MSHKLALIGGGGHALSLIDILPSSLQVAGYVDFSPSGILPLKYLGDDPLFLSTASPEEYDVMVTFVSGCDCSLQRRAEIINRYKGFSSPIIIADSAIVSDKASVSDGCMVFNRAVVNSHATIAPHTVINTGAIIEHGCKIDKNVFIGPGAILCGGVNVGENTYIGAGAVIIPGVRICPDCIIGAGTVLIKDVTDPGTYVGNPARRIK